MLKSQKLEIKSVELRQKLAELSALDTLTDEQRDELKTKTLELRDCEAQRVAALEVENSETETRETSTEDAETRELRSIEGKVDFSDYLTAALELRGVNDGAALEYNQALGIAPNFFPLQKLAPSIEELEERATTDTDTKTMPRRWIDRLFYGTAAQRLGITFESVQPGVASYPVTTAGSTAAQRGRTEAASAAAWTVGVSELKPTRNAVHAVFSVEDVARIGSELESALMRDLRSALVAGIDKAIFIGDDGANENGADITGLQTASIAESTITQANKVKADKTLETFVKLVDGLHAESMADLRIVTSVPANALWMTTIHNSAASNETVAQFLRASGMSWSARGELSDGTGNGKFGAYVGLGRGISGAAVVPVWAQGQMLRDPYSGAKTGEVSLTIHTLWNFGLPRTSNYKRIKYVA